MLLQNMSGEKYYRFFCKRAKELHLGGLALKRQAQRSPKDNIFWQRTGAYDEGYTGFIIKIIESGAERNQINNVFTLY